MLFCLSPPPLYPLLPRPPVPVSHDAVGTFPGYLMFLLPDNSHCNLLEWHVSGTEQLHRAFILLRREVQSNYLDGENGGVLI